MTSPFPVILLLRKEKPGQTVFPVTEHKTIYWVFCFETEAYSVT